MRTIWIALALGVGIVGSASANIIQVPSAHSTIQAGINAAASGDTVEVAPGTYTGASNRNLDFGGKNILLRSSAGAATTIIDCQNLARGIRFHTGETAAAVVQGFTIRNGLASGTFGGGILVEGGANPTIRNCRFESNHANNGGGICALSGITLTGCEFEDNTAENWGGALYGDDANVQSSGCTFTQNQAGLGAGIYVGFGTTMTLTDCTFTENAPANLAGGVYASASTVTIERCHFVRNTGKHGAGLYLLAGTANVDSCTFTSNTATYSGGGMQAENVAPLILTGCTFEGNSTVTYNFQFDSGGGGLRLQDTSAINGSQVIDCVFRENHASGDNGAGSGGGLLALSDALILRCMFIDNHAESVGGGVRGSTGPVRNCVFEGNTSVSSAGLYGGEEVTDCRFTDNHALDFGGGCDSGGDIIRCEFSGNSAGNRGGAVYQPGSGSFSIVDSRFSDNYAGQGGAVARFLGQPSSTTTFTGCTFVGNTAAVGGAVNLQGSGPGSVTISGCTLVANGAQFGGGISMIMPVEISNTIIAFGTEGEAVACSGNGLGVMSCTDIFGNAGGDWTACIADQVGINGNFALDPRFCNVGARDYTLAQTSPCTAANAPAGCGLIGAHPVGCASPIGIADTGAPAVTPILRVTPNPVRGSGTIEWSGVGGRGDGGLGAAELRLYDAGGRLVARHMGNGESSAGAAAERLSWNALVGSKSVPSGVYFLQLGKDERTAATVRLVVIR